jgi:hypothetical protein
MKNFLLGFFLCLALCMGTAAAFRGFGPAQTKALIKVILAEFNRNRDWHGKPHITVEQVRDELEQATTEISTNLANDPDLSWMVELQ